MRSMLGMRYIDRADKVICSHHLYTVLASVSKQLEWAVDIHAGRAGADGALQHQLGWAQATGRQWGELDYHRFGTFTLNDFLKVHEANPGSFEEIVLFDEAESQDSRALRRSA